MSKIGFFPQKAKISTLIKDGPFDLEGYEIVNTSIDMRGKVIYDSTADTVTINDGIDCKTVNLILPQCIPSDTAIKTYTIQQTGLTFDNIKDVSYVVPYIYQIPQSVKLKLTGFNSAASAWGKIYKNGTELLSLTGTGGTQTVTVETTIIAGDVFRIYLFGKMSTQGQTYSMTGSICGDEKLVLNPDLAAWS